LKNEFENVGYSRSDEHSNRFYTLMAIAALLIGFVASSYFLFLSSQGLTKAADRRYSSYLLADELRQSSDDLTRMVRTFAATGDPRFEKQFLAVLAIRNGEKQRPENYYRIYWDFVAILKSIPDNNGGLLPLRQLMIDEGMSESELALLKKAQNQSDALVALETVAMRAINDTLTDADENYRKIGESNRDMAIRLLHGPEYHQAKVKIMEPIQKFLTKLDVRTDTDVKKYATRSNSLLILSIGIIIVVLMLTIYLWRLHQHITNIEKNWLDDKNKELQKHRQTLLINEHRMQQTAKLTHTGYWLWDELADCAISCSEECANIYGVSVNEFVAKSKNRKNVRLWCHPKDKESVRQQYEHYLACPTSISRTYRILTEQNEVRWIHEIAEPEFDADGLHFQTKGVIQDITERKQIEKDLKSSESNLNLLVQTQTDLISRFSPDGILNFVNQSYAEFMGKDVEQLIGRSLFTDVPPEEHKLIRENFSRLSVDCPTYTTENHIENGAGEYRVHEWINHAYFDDDGSVSEIQSVGRDVTEIRRARDRAEAANIAKSDFLSTMSHEIRTPLNGVLGIAQLLRDTKLDDDQQRMLATILSSGHTLLAIINDVLDMSKIEAGGMELEEKPFCLKALLSTITTPFQSLSDDKGLKLIVNSDISKELVVRGDPVRLRQIIWNLLSNAIKFTEEGQVSLSIVSDRSTDNEGLDEIDIKDHLICFTVEDTGAGIAPDRVDAIFDTFTQEDSSITRKHGGTGLGLSIVKQLTELMGGTIKADSELDKGTIFSVHIPFKSATEAEVEAIALRSEFFTSEKQRPLNILLAEDNEVNAFIAKAFLEKFGHSIRHVENGLLAVEATKKNWADLILMDVHMPEMNGIDATKAIRATEIGKYLPIIGLTAEAFTERHTLFIEAGMNDVITKPFTEQQLTDTLAANGLIDRRGRNREK